MRDNKLLIFVEKYFRERLADQCNASPHTISSYRDAWRLLLKSTAERRGCDASRVRIEDITAKRVLEFLDEVEANRGVSIGTRNCRLAALRSFSRYMVSEDPLLASQFDAILRIPTKRCPQPSMSYLESDEVAAIFRQPNRRRIEGERDYALLHLLYFTGARIQEALDLDDESVRWKPPFQVKLIGKGRKERVCPLTPETVNLLQRLISRDGREPGPIFTNRLGGRLSSSGVRFKLAEYVRSAAKDQPSLLTKRISPHTFRHSAGVALIAADVDITVIRSMFGHASLDTTNRYARANIEVQRAALEKMDPKNRGAIQPNWQSGSEVMRFLDQLSSRKSDHKDPTEAAVRLKKRWRR